MTEPAEPTPLTASELDQAIADAARAYIAAQTTRPRNPAKAAAAKAGLEALIDQRDALDAAADDPGDEPPTDVA